MPRTILKKLAAGKRLTSADYKKLQSAGYKSKLIKLLNIMYKDKSFRKGIKTATYPVWYGYRLDLLKKKYGKKKK